MGLWVQGYVIMAVKLYYPILIVLVQYSAIRLKFFQENNIFKHQFNPMTKKEIKAFFKAVKDKDLPTVIALVTANPEYLSITNLGPPKMDDGQSALQVAFKNGSFDVARFLVEQGADVNFMEQSEINQWTAPVLHDCIRATIFNTYTLQKDTAKFDRAFSLLNLLLNKKANPNAIDSYGNNCLHRAFLDSRQMIDHPDANLSNGIIFTQLRSVFKALINAGADVNLANEQRPSVVSLITDHSMGEYGLI